MPECEYLIDGDLLRLSPSPTDFALHEIQESVKAMLDSGVDLTAHDLVFKITFEKKRKVGEYGK